ncbi:hypothetical protein CRU99_03915 [Malaciobacter mytili]|uniref:Lipoprotein n=1 Tax=Malaciobacter mytili LMG 24559 TaxID=1032238 RepID=A0AAX2AJ68_9BACT|nr:hypothetical protein [Malaciobacter mytili]AXH15242.1 hypothetical protein AMYT_1668 [Malaciobacter mytili LMG 24559]RXI45455.1 hypothetical protein CRU99_03915 [Malaciobacter mytili]RXK15566.1 hypothetical protein CP985_07895 [Malaciobacter mytili LMG 24559]
MLKLALVATSTIFLFSGCFNQNVKEEWTSFIYPDKENTKRSMKSGVYATLNECKEASLNKLKSLGLEGDYICGLNCTFNEEMKTEVCKKMAK